MPYSPVRPAARFMYSCSKGHRHEVRTVRFLVVAFGARGSAAGHGGGRLLSGGRSHGSGGCGSGRLHG